MGRSGTGVEVVIIEDKLMVTEGVIVTELAVGCKVVVADLVCVLEKRVEIASEVFKLVVLSLLELKVGLETINVSSTIVLMSSKLEVEFETETEMLSCIVGELKLDNVFIEDVLVDEVTSTVLLIEDSMVTTSGLMVELENVDVSSIMVVIPSAVLDIKLVKDSIVFVNTKAVGELNGICIVVEDTCKLAVITGSVSMVMTTEDSRLISGKIWELSVAGFDVSAKVKESTSETELL